MCLYVSVVYECLCVYMSMLECVCLYVWVLRKTEERINPYHHRQKLFLHIHCVSPLLLPRSYFQLNSVFHIIESFSLNHVSVKYLSAAEEMVVTMTAYSEELWFLSVTSK